MSTKAGPSEEPPTDAAALLSLAQALEPSMRLAEREQALAQLEELLDHGELPPAPPGRDWRLELLAERAFDAARFNRLDEARELAEWVLRSAPAEQATATARATEALGRVLAWTGTPSTTREADKLLTEAARRYRALQRPDWEGSVTFWRGNAVYLQNGQLDRAVELFEAALKILGPASPRRTGILTFYAEALSFRGEWEAAAALLDEVDALVRDRDFPAGPYASWQRARIASCRGDPLATERHLRDVERDAPDWFFTDTGVTFLADAAELLDRVGLHAQAADYLDRAVARSPRDEFVLQATAALLARGGDPIAALDALQELPRGDWLERRLCWRHTLLLAWATFRAGRGPAGDLAARALREAGEVGGTRVALAGEPELTEALLPLAEEAGSAAARALLLEDRELIVRLFGTPRMTLADGTPVAMPGGTPGQLVRLLALHPHGLSVDEVTEWFFPEATPASGRQRLRQTLTRMRASAGELVIREGDRLRLRPAWVDVEAFRTAADGVRATRGPRAIQLAYAALATRTGPLLPTDRYAHWAAETRMQVESRYLELLDLIATDANARGAVNEALTALSAAHDADPTDPERTEKLAGQLLRVGRPEAANYLTQAAEGSIGDAKHGYGD